MNFSQNLSKKIYGIPFIWIINILVLFFFITWINSIFNGFVWDDEEQIVNNVIIQHLSNFPFIFSGATFGTGGAGLSGWFFRPFLTLSYMLLFAIFNTNAWGYHLLQVIIHFINSILIFKILQKLLNKTQETKITFLNFLISIIFSIHPIVTEAVSYIAASSEVLYSFFNLSAFYLILKNDSRNISLWTLIKISLLLFSGLLFKESSIVIFPILEVYILIHRFKEWKKWTITLTPTFLIYFFIRLAIIHTPIRSPEFSPISEASLATRLITIPKEFFSYIQLIFYPNNLAISQHFVITNILSADFYIPLFLDLLFITFLLFFIWKQKSKIILFGLMWFLLGFALISNIFPLDMTIAERWIYFPFIGFVIMTTGALYELSKKLKDRFTYVLILLFILLIPLGIRTIIRNSNWQNGLSIYSHDEKVSVNSFDLENNLGVELFRNGDYKNAKIHFEKSIKLQPKWYFTYNNLGATYQRENNTQKAKELYKKTLSLSDYYLAYENLAGIYYQEDSPETLTFVLNALKKLPNNFTLNKIAAITYYQQGSTESAKIYAQKTYNLNPTTENYSMLQEILAH